MKHYELNCFLSPNLSQEELDSLSGKIQKYIQEEEGSIVGIKILAKKSLFYSIKTKLHPKTDAANFISLDFDALPEKLKNIEKNLKAESNILRFLILNKIIRKEMLSPRRTRPEQEVKELKPEKTKKEKVKLEEIEEKLEEILKNT